jgi:hypothetical protein
LKNVFKAGKQASECRRSQFQVVHLSALSIGWTVEEQCCKEESHEELGATVRVRNLTTQISLNKLFYCTGKQFKEFFAEELCERKLSRISQQDEALRLSLISRVQGLTYQAVILPVPVHEPDMWLAVISLKACQGQLARQVLMHII